jgi:signal transduction histidine kinase
VPIEDAERLALGVDHATAGGWLFEAWQLFTHVGKVSVHARPGQRDPGAIELEVSDTGQGMPPERVREMFELFTQGDGSSRRTHDGLGLGLTRVQRAVRVLGGDVRIESRPGEGSTVRVLIPNALALPQGAAALSS